MSDYRGQGPIPIGDMENWNTDRTVEPPVMVRGMMVKNSGAWNYWDGIVGVSSGFNIPAYDFIDCSYTGSNLTDVVYKISGVSGTMVAELALTYDGSGNLLTVSKIFTM